MTEEVKTCIEQAERFLVLREHNKAELIDKLKAKGYESPVIDTAIEFLISSDELNEERYIRAFIRSSNKKHPEGKIAVSQRLFAKKADKDLTKQLLDFIYTEDYVETLIEDALKKLEKKGKTPEKFQKKQELLKLGFTSSQIYAFFDKI